MSSVTENAPLSPAERIAMIRAAKATQGEQPEPRANHWHDVALPQKVELPPDAPRAYACAPDHETVAEWLDVSPEQEQAIWLAHGASFPRVSPADAQRQRERMRAVPDRLWGELTTGLLGGLVYIDDGGLVQPVTDEVIDAKIEVWEARVQAHRDRIPEPQEVDGVYLGPWDVESLVDLPTLQGDQYVIESRGLTRDGYEQAMILTGDHGKDPSLEDYYLSIPDQEKHVKIDRSWTIVRSKTHVPAPLSQSDYREFAEQWRDELPAVYRDIEMLVILVPGDPITAVVRTGPADHEHIMRDLDNCYTVPRLEWQGNDSWILLPSRTALRWDDIPDHGEEAPPAVRTYSSGLSDLDAVFRAGGIPAGGYLVVQGPTSALKTTWSLHLACAIADAPKPRRVLWLAAGDERAVSIRRRLEQRPGGSPKGLKVIDRSERYSLGACLATRPDALILDSLQGYAGSDRNELDGIIAQIRESDVLVISTSEETRSGTAKGTSAIDYRATTQMRLRANKDKTKLHVSIGKNRDGAEYVSLEYEADKSKQTISIPPTEPEIDAATIRADVLDYVRRDPTGKTSRTKIRGGVSGSREAIDAAIDALLADGTIIQDGRRIGPA